MKTQLTETDLKFDLKFLLVGASGVGKTHLCGTYTKGPIHFYSTDPGGEKTLFKLLKGRPDHAPITIDKFNINEQTYQDFWKKLQEDAKDGFFDQMSEQQGLVVLPDSLTTLSMMALESVAKKHKRDLTNLDKIMRIQDWGVLGAWLKELISAINTIPCAIASTAHLHIDTDENGAVIARSPLIQGKLRYTMGLFYDEVYLLERRGKDHIIYMKEHKMFEAKTRTFPDDSIKNITLDNIADAYLQGKALKEVISTK